MTDVNRNMFAAVVNEMGDLRDEVVFVGGVVAGLLITSPATDPIRETDDVDCVVEIGASSLNYRTIETRLGTLGWHPGSMTNPDDPLCRFRKGLLILDVMPTQEEVLGFAGRWLKEAIEHPISETVGDRVVQIVSAPYFLGLKIEAFINRGNGDYYASHDLEDFVAVIEGRPTIVDEVQNAATELQKYLAENLNEMWSRLASETIPGAVRGDSNRLRIIEQRLHAIRKIASEE